jgi:hypothetical protein
MHLYELLVLGVFPYSLSADLRNRLNSYEKF